MMQALNLVVQAVKVTVIDDNIIRDRKAFFPARLGGEDGVNLACGNSVPCGNPLVLQFPRCVYDQDAVQRIVQADSTSNGMTRTQ